MKKNTKIMKKLKDQKMARLFFKAFIICLIAFIYAPQVYSKDILKGTLLKDVNLRTGPGMSYPSQGLLSKGWDVTILAPQSNGWYYVLFKGADQYNNQVDYKGYISAQFIKTYTVEDYSDLPKVDGLYGTEERSTIGCENISPQYDYNNDCRLKINASSANYDTVLKICKVGSGECIRMVYVREGSTYIVKNIPFGTYYIKIASGSDMRKKIDKYGNCLIVFVKNAIYEKTETTFRFYRETNSKGYCDVGWEYVLNARISTSNSESVPSEDISPEEFNR